MSRKIAFFSTTPDGEDSSSFDTLVYNGLPVGGLVKCASEGGISASGFSVSGNFDKELPESRKGHVQPV